MNRLWRTRSLYIISDAIASIAALLVLNLSRYEIGLPKQEFASFATYITHPNTLLSTSLALLLAMSVYALSGYYNKPYAKSRMSDIASSLSSSIIIAGIVFLLVVSDDITADTSHYLKLFGILLASLFTLLYIGRAFVTHRLLHQSVAERHKRRILLVEEGNIGREVGEWLQGAGRMKIVERLTLAPREDEEHDQYLGTVATTLRAWAQEHKADEIVIATTHCSFHQISRLLYRLYVLGIPIKLSPRSIDYAGIKLRVDSMLGEPLVDLTAHNMTQSSANIKWLADRVLALLGLILLSPLYAYISWRIRRESSGEIIYKQERIGLRGKPFMIYKFRSMYRDAESRGPQLSQDDDPRITPWGRTMRKYRLDELPQLWNVLRGDMSIVGPRPERAYYLRQLMDYAPGIFLLHNVRPGITSWAMVRYGYASSLEQMKERLAYDWLYYENMSIKLDLIILFYTVQTIAKGLGK